MELLQLQKLFLLLSTGFKLIFASISCSFDQGWCGWSNKGNSDFLWQMNSGQTDDRTSGPLNDHTCNNAMGKYIYMTGSDVKSKDSIAIFRSEPLSLGIQSNLSFWYHMNGFGIGQLVLSKIKEKKSEELWKMEGRQGQGWLQGSVLLNPGKFTLEFSGTAVLPYSSDTALDDIQLHSESSDFDKKHCIPTSTTTQSTTTTTTTTTSPISTTSVPIPVGCPTVDTPVVVLPGSCNFETDLCGNRLYINSTAQIMPAEWERTSKPNGYGDVLIEGGHEDHAKGSKGFYMNFKNGWLFSRAVIIASIETQQLTTNFVCLTFWYNMPSNYSNLNVWVKHEGILREIWKRDMYFLGAFPGWHYISLVIYEKPPFSVVFQTYNKEHQARVGIDDLLIIGANITASTELLSSLKDTERLTSTKTPGTASVEPSSASSTESTGLLMTSEALSSNPSLDSSTHSGGLNISTDIVLGTLFPTINTTTTTTTTTNLPVTPRLSTSSINSDGTHTTSSMNLFTSTVGGVKTTNYEVTSLKFHSTDRVNKSHASTLSTKLMTSSINTISAYKTSTDMTVPFISNSAKFSHETSTPHPTKQNIADVSLISSVTDEIRDTSTISSSLKTNFEKTTRITDEIRDTSTISSSPKTNFDKTTPITDEIRDTSTISSSLKTNFEKTTRITDEIRDTSTISSSPKTNFDKTTPITDEIRDTSTISSSPKTNFDKTTPITDEIRDTSTISSSPKTNFDKTTPITDEIRDTSTISSSPKTNFDKTTPITDEIRDTSTISSSLKTTFDKTTPINLDTEKNQLFSSLVTSSSTMMHTDITVQTKQNITKHTNYPVTPRKTSLFTQTNTSYESTQSTISFSPPINTSFSPSLLPDTTRPAKPNTTIATHRPATDQRNDVHIGTKESIKTTTTFRPTLSSDKTTHTVDSKTTTVPKWNVTRRVDMSLTVTGNTESAASSTLRQPVTSISSGSSDSSSSTLRQPVTSTSSGSNESPSSTLRQPVTSTSSGSNESPSSTLRQPVTSISSGSHESSSSQTSGTLPNGFTSSLNFTSSSAYTSPATETTVTPISSGSNESSSSQTSGTLPNGFTSSLNFTSSSAYTSPATGTSEQSTATLNGTTIRRKEQQTGIDEDTLSTAAIFGIAVGSLCVLALLGSVVYCSCRTRRSLHYSNPYSPSSNGGVNHMKNSSLANGNMKNGNVHIEYEKPGTSNGVLKTDNVFIYEMTTETMVHNENMSNGLDQSCSFNTRL